MRIHTRFGDRMMMLKRNLRVIFADVSIRETLRTLVWLWLIGVLLFFILWRIGYLLDARLCVGGDGEGHAPTGWEYLFCLIGAVDADPIQNTVCGGFYSIVVRLMGAVMIGGFVTSCLCALAGRISEMALNGLIVSPMYGHVVIIGYDDQTDDLVRKLLLPESEWDDLTCWYPTSMRRWRRDRHPKILLYTCGDVESIRNELNALLPRKFRKYVQYVYGEMGFSRVVQTDVRRSLSLQYARQIFIMGDRMSPSRGDIENLGCADAVSEMLKGRPRHPIGPYRDFPVPVFVRMDRIASFDLPKRMDFKLAMPNIERSRRLEDVKTYFKPFSVNEGWARAMWGGTFPLYPPIGLEDRPDKWHDSRLSSRLDFRPMFAGDYVHLVVGPLNALAEALVIEAVRVAHYPCGEPARITVVESSDAVCRRFRARYEQAFSLEDVRIDFLDGDFNAPSVRRLLAESADDRHCLLTIAICEPDSDESLETAVSLPENVYYGYDAQEGVAPADRLPTRLAYRKDPPRIWFHQAHFCRLDAGGERRPQVRYRQVLPFGMEELGIRPWYLKGFPAMYLNAVYDWPFDANGENKLDELLAARNGAFADLEKFVRPFQRKWERCLTREKVQSIDIGEKVALLERILCHSMALTEAFQAYAFRRLVMMDCARMWGNIYVEDSYMTLLRALGLYVALPDASRERGFAALCRRNRRVFDGAFRRVSESDRLERSLTETEHRRRIADRALMGFRNVRADAGECKDSAFRHHEGMIPFRSLTPEEANKDLASLTHVPLFLALDGLELYVEKEDG